MAQKKINDDTLLQLIRDGNSPAGAVRREQMTNQRSANPRLACSYDFEAKAFFPSTLHHSLPFLLFAASGCRFWLPLLVAVWQG
ncbi:MAG: hypothetical protein ACLQVJ_28820 [Syntrophobacteraceae bacterium]